MLSDIKVLEISSPTTMMAGRLLADLGADVIVIEPPAGATGRRLPPFQDNRPGLEQSLTWHALNQNKRGITLDLDAPDAKFALQALLKDVDIVIERLETGEVSKLEGLDGRDALVHAIIRPFDPDGAKGHYAVTDAVMAAAGGGPAPIGTVDHAPIFCPVPQNIMDTGAETAVACLVGIMSRDLTGKPANPTILSRIASMMPALGRMLRDGPEVKRGTVTGRSFPGLPVVPATYDCSDGVMVVSVPMGRGFQAMSVNLTKFLVDAGELSEELGQLNWIDTVQEIGRGEKPKSLFEDYIGALKRVCLQRRRMEMLEASREYGFLASPVFSMKDLYEFEHYAERGLFADTTINELPVKLPYRIAQFDNYEIEITRPAPSLSQHTADILGTDVGLSDLEIQALFAHGII